MARIKIEDLESMSSEDIGSFFIRGDISLLPEKARNYLDISDKEPYFDYVFSTRSSRIIRLLEKIIIIRFTNKKL